MKIWIVLFLLAACTTIPSQTGELDILFCQVDDCAEEVMDVINSSEDIKCAFYDLDYEPLQKLLSQKNAEVLVFERNYEGFGTSIPAAHGGLMHDKFCILDEIIVITGSTNPTENGFLKNDNNIIIIEGEVTAQNYLKEFFELGGKKEQRTQNKEITHFERGENFLIENYFCPEDECEEEVLEKLEKAEESILFMTFSFTSDPIGELLIRKGKEGVIIQGVFEKRQENKYSEYPKLVEAGLDVRFDSNPQTMHHKVFIIDNETVILGSYNPSKNGNTRNDENVVIIHDRNIAEAFSVEFSRVWSHP